jgi:hypothetical protein
MRLQNKKRHGFHHGAGLNEGHSIENWSEKAQLAETVVAAANLAAGGDIEAAVETVAMIFPDVVAVEKRFRHFNGFEGLVAARISAKNAA